MESVNNIYAEYSTLHTYVVHVPVAHEINIIFVLKMLRIYVERRGNYNYFHFISGSSSDNVFRFSNINLSLTLIIRNNCGTVKQFPENIIFMFTISLAFIAL